MQKKYMINRVQIISVLMIACLFLSQFISNHILFILISIVALCLCFKQFVIDRKELKDALHYCRKDIPNYRIVLGFLVAIAIWFIWPYTPFDIDNKNITVIYAVIIYFGLIFATRYDHFMRSLRSFEEGIKLPGRKSPIIAWEEVTDMKIEKETLTITIHGDTTTFNCDRRDTNDLRAIVDYWENKKIESN